MSSVTSEFAESYFCSGKTLGPTMHSDSMEAHCEQTNSDSADQDSVADDDSSLDPRIKVELDILNQASMDINRLENELDEARSKYGSTFSASSQKMEELGAKIRKNIQRARQYFELTEKAKEAQSEAVRAARQYQTASSIYRAAKETIALAELRLIDEDSGSASLSSAWQEMLNHATVRVMDAEREKTRSEGEHLKRSAVFAELEAHLHRLEAKYKRSIAKARPYFETKAELELKLQQLKQNVWDLQQAIVIRKSRYAEALHRLESISEEIHESRRNKLLLMFPREPGVGAECDGVGSSVSDINIEKGLFPPISPTTDSCFNEEDSEKSDVTDGGESRASRRASRVHDDTIRDHAGSHRRQGSCDSTESSDSNTSESTSSSGVQSDACIFFVAPTTGETLQQTQGNRVKGENCAAACDKGEHSDGDKDKESVDSCGLHLQDSSLSDSGISENPHVRLAGDGSSCNDLCTESTASVNTVWDNPSTSTVVNLEHTPDPETQPEASGVTDCDQHGSHDLPPKTELSPSSGVDCVVRDSSVCDLACQVGESVGRSAAEPVGSSTVPESGSGGQASGQRKRSLRKGVMLLNPSKLATTPFWKLH